MRSRGGGLAAEAWASLVVCLLLATRGAPAQNSKPCSAPLSVTALTTLIRGDVHERRLLYLIGACGLAPDVRVDSLTTLKAAGATAPVLSDVRRVVQERDARLAAEQEEQRAWQSAIEDGTAARLDAYLERYPRGAHADTARERLRALRLATGAPHTASAQAAPESTAAQRVQPAPPSAQSPPPAAEPAPTPTFGVLVFSVVPWGDVKVDGTVLGSTPLRPRQMPVGEHVVRITHPKFGSVERRVTIQAGETTRLSVDMSREAVRPSK